MRLTTKGRYAVTAMLDLALHAHTHPVSLSDISQRQGISLSYLEQLFSKLRQQALVRSVRGPGGGYLLNRDAQDIHVAEIIEAVDESMEATRCGNLANCQNGQACLTHHLWADLSEHISQFLSNISLANLLEREDILQVAEQQTQHSLERISSV